MEIEKRKCNLCNQEHEVVMTSPISRYFKVCLECYTKADRTGQKNYGSPTINRNLGTHKPESLDDILNM